MRGFMHTCDVHYGTCTNMGGSHVPDESEDEDTCYHHSGRDVCSVQAVMVTSSASAAH